MRRSHMFHGATHNFGVVICARVPGTAGQERSTFKQSHGLASLF
ncbi:hypothetical protein AGR13a_Cc260020 [Agrobacterium genomosp. 13 str. CFBP 6927]|uniref:Uncharacterized protein n=1 Tax=Agrobacterium genomosp. 13 str. CFBP 6927 TaxID=1183428 RepID=A0ABM9VET0_9HYPH|nr:hypothetical protein AGR13a_Cc260020 [Agrobacterium genomosp. 13 str. CFBP 6927]